MDLLFCIVFFLLGCAGMACERLMSRYGLDHQPNLTRLVVGVLTVAACACFLAALFAGLSWLRPFVVARMGLSAAAAVDCKPVVHAPIGKGGC